MTAGHADETTEPGDEKTGRGDELLARLVAGDLSVHEHDELLACANADASLTRRLVGLLRSERLLADVIAGDEHGAGFVNRVMHGLRHGGDSDTFTRAVMTTWRMPTLRRRVAAAALVAACLASLFWGLLGRSSVEYPRLENGTATIDGSAAVKGHALTAGVSVQAITAATLRYADGSRLRLEPGTHLELRPGPGKRLALLDGQLEAEVTTQPDGAPMRIGGASGEITVVGTRFCLAVAHGVLRLGVSHGLVRVTGSSGELLVEAGGSALVHSDGHPQSIVSFSTDEDSLGALAVANTMGVALHLDYTYSPYSERLAEIITLLRASGLRHARVSVPDRATLARVRQVCDAGIGVTCVLSPREHLVLAGPGGWDEDLHANIGDLRVIERSRLDAIQLYGGIDDPGPAYRWSTGDAFVDDLAAPLAWSRYLHALATRSSDLLRAEPKLAGVPLVASMLEVPHRAADLPDCTPLVDVDAVRAFPIPAPTIAASAVHRHQGNEAWICAACAMPEDLARDALARPSLALGLPRLVTATGYPTGEQGVSEAAQGRYVARVFLENARLGIVRTFWYELLDESGTTGHEAAYGLLRSDCSPKPAFKAVTSLCRLLGTTPDPSPQRLRYALAFPHLPVGGADRVRHLLLRRGDGALLLVLWCATVSADLSVGPARDLTAPDSQALVLVEARLRGAVVHAIDAHGEDVVSEVPDSDLLAIPCPLSDRITVVELRLNTPM